MIMMSVADRSVNLGKINKPIFNSFKGLLLNRMLALQTMDKSSIGLEVSHSIPSGFPLPDFGRDHPGKQ